MFVVSHGVCTCPQADDLSQDLASRRKRSVASILGRTKVSAEQMGVLMAGSPSVSDVDPNLSRHSEGLHRCMACMGVWLAVYR